MTEHSASLSWDVYVAPPEPMPRGGLASGEKERSWSPISATLISGEKPAWPRSQIHPTHGQEADQP